MLKYVDTLVSFQEVPDEITLCINISNCPCHCEGCHSPWLAEDIGKPLDEDALVELLLDNKGVSCICFMGGDSEPYYINWLADIIRTIQADASAKGSWADVKIAWYSGRQYIPDEIKVQYFDYIKIGPYIPKLGGLDKETTNQIMYKIEDDVLTDITYRFRHENY